MERRRRKWTAREQWLNIRIEDEAGRSVCTVYGLNDSGRRHAHEIAALPDLLETLKRLASFEAMTAEGWGFGHPELTARVELARKAITSISRKETRS